MTYGVYTSDLSGQSLGERYTIEECKEWCWGDHVICSEKDKVSGISVTVSWHKHWAFRFKWYWQEMELGFLRITWNVNKYKWADKIVWRPENKEEK